MVFSFSRTNLRSSSSKHDLFSQHILTAILATIGESSYANQVDICRFYLAFVFIFSQLILLLNKPYAEIYY